MSLQGTTGLGGGIAKSVLQGGETEIGPIAVSGYYPLYSTKKGAETAGNGAIDEVEVDGSKYFMPQNGVFRWDGDFSPSFDEVPLSIAGYYPVYKTRIKAWSEAIADGAEGKKVLEETMVVWGDDNMAYYHPNVYAPESWQGTFATTKRAEDIRLTEQSLMSSDPGFGIDGVAVGRNDSGIIIAVGASAAQDRDGIVPAGAAIMNPDVNDDTYVGLDYALTPPANDMSGKVYIYDKDQNLLAELVCPDRDASDAMMADGHAVGFGYEVAIGEGIIAVTSSKFERTKISDISLFPLYAEKGSVRTWHPDIDENYQKPPMRQVDVTGYKAERQAQGAVHIFDANTFEHKYSLVDKYTEDNAESPGKRTSVTYGSALSIGHGRLAIGDRFCQAANVPANDGTGDDFTFEARGAVFVYDITKPTGLEVQNSELMIKRPSNLISGIPNHSGNFTASYGYARWRASFGERGKMKIGSGSLIVGDPRFNDYRSDYDHSIYTESHYTHIEGDELPWSTGAVFAFNMADGKLKWSTDGLDNELEWLADNEDLTASYSLDRTRLNRLGTGWGIDISGDKIFVLTYRGGDNQTNVDGLIGSFDNSQDVNSLYNIGSCLVMSPDGDILSTVRRRRVTAGSGTDGLAMANGTGNASSMAADGNTVYFGVPGGDATLDSDSNTGFIEIYTVGTGDSYNDQGHKAANHVGTFHSAQRDPLYHTDLRYALNGIGDQQFGSRVLTHENTLLATSIRYYPFTEVYYYDIDDVTKEEDGPKAVSGYYPLYNTKKYASAASATNQCERVTVDNVVYYRPSYDGAAPTKWDGDFTAASETGPMAVDGHYPLYLTKRAAYLESLVPERKPSMRFSVDVVSTDNGNKFRMRTDTEHTTYTALPKMYRNIFTLERGKTYVFDQQLASNENHPLQWSLTEDGDSITDTEFVRSFGVAGGNGNNSSAGYTTVTIPSDFAGDRLYYKCGNHAGMGSLGYAEIRDPGIASTDQVTLNDVIYYIPKGVTYFDGDYDSATSETGPLEINGYYPLYLTHSAAKDGGDDPILVDVPAQDINYYMPSDVDIKRTYGTFGTKSAQEMFSDRIDLSQGTMGTFYSQLRGDSSANNGNAYVTDKYIIFGDDQHVVGSTYYSTHPVTRESMGGGKVILFRKDGTFFADLSPNYLLKKKYPADADSIQLNTGSTTWPSWGTSVAATDKWLVVGGPTQKGIPGQGRSDGAVVVFDISKTTLEEIEASMQVLVYDDNDDPITDHPDPNDASQYGGNVIISQFGLTVSISDDNSTIVVGAPTSWSDEVWKTLADTDSPVNTLPISPNYSKAYHQRYNKYGRTFVYALNESTDVWEADGEVTVPYWANKWNANRYPVWSNWSEQVWDVPSFTSFARTGIAYRHWGHTVAVGKNHIAVACEAYFATSTSEKNTSNMEKYPAVVAVFDRHTKEYLYTHGTKAQNAGKESHFGETMKFLEIQGTEYLFVSSHTAGENSLYGYWQTKEEGALYIYDYSKPNPGGEETILRMNHMVESGRENEFGRVFGANDTHIFVQVTGYSSNGGVRKATHTGEYVGYDYPTTTNSSNQYVSDVRNTFIIPVEDVLGHRGTLNAQNYVLLGASGNLGTSYVYDIAVDNDILVVSNQSGTQDSTAYQYETDDGTVKNVAITIYNLKKTADDLRLNVEGYYPVWEFENLSNSESSDGQSNEYVLNGKTYYQPVSPSYSTWQGDYVVGLPPIAIDGHYPVYETILDAQAVSIDSNHEIFVGSDGITYYKPVSTKFTTWEGDYDATTSETGPLEVTSSYPLYLTYDGAVNASPTSSATAVNAGGVRYWFPDGVFGNSEGQHMFDLNELSVSQTWREHGIRPFNFDADGNLVERGNIGVSSESLHQARFGHTHDGNDKYIAFSSPMEQYLPDMTVQTGVGQVRIFKHNTLGLDTFIGAVSPNNADHVADSFGYHCVYVSQDGFLYVMGTELRSDGKNYDVVYEYDLNSENEATIQGSQYIYRQTSLIGLNDSYGPELVSDHSVNIAANSNLLFVGAPAFRAEHTTDNFMGAIVIFNRSTKAELAPIFAREFSSRFGSNLAANDFALMAGSTFSTDQLYIYEIDGETFTFKGNTIRNNTNATGMGWGLGAGQWHKFVNGYYYMFNNAPGTQYQDHGISGVNQGSQYSMARIYRWKEEDALNILTAMPDKWYQLRDIPGASRTSWAGPTNIDISATFIVMTSNGQSPEETYMWSTEEDISTAITIPTSDYFEYGMWDVTIVGRKFYVGVPNGIDPQYYEETADSGLRHGKVQVYDGTINPDRIPSAVGGHYPVFQFELSAQQASTDGEAVSFDHDGQRYFKPNAYPYTTWSGDYSISDGGAPHIVDSQYPLYKTIGAAMLGSIDESYEVVEMSDGGSYFKPSGVRTVGYPIIPVSHTADQVSSNLHTDVYFGTQGEDAYVKSIRIDKGTASSARLYVAYVNGNYLSEDDKAQAVYSNGTSADGSTGWINSTSISSALDSSANTYLESDDHVLITFPTPVLLIDGTGNKKVQVRGLEGNVITVDIVSATENPPAATVQSVIDGDIGPTVINGNYPCFDSHLASNAESSAYNGSGASTTFIHEGALYFQPAGSSITLWTDGTYGVDAEDTAALVVNTDGTVGATTGSYPLYQSRLAAESVSWGVGQSTPLTYGGVTYFMPSGTFVTTFTGNDYSLDATYQLDGETYRYDEAVYSPDGEGNTYYPVYFAEADAIAGGDGTASSMTLPFNNPSTGLSQTTFFVANGVTLITDYVPGVSDVEKLVVDAHYPLYLTAASAIKESPTNSYTRYTLSGTTYFMPNDVLYETFIGTLGKLNNRTDVMNTEQRFDFSELIPTNTSSNWWCKVAAGKNFIAVAAYNTNKVLILDYDMNHLYTLTSGNSWGDYQYGSMMKWAPETCDNPDVLYVGDHKYSDSSSGRYGRIYRYDCSLGGSSAINGSRSYLRDTYGSYYRDFGKAFDVSDNYLFVGSPGYYPSTLLYENPQHGSLLSTSLLKRRDTGTRYYYLGESVAISADREDGKPDIFAAAEPYNYRYGRVRFYGPDLSGERTSPGGRYQHYKGNMFFKEDEYGNRYLVNFNFDYYSNLYETYYQEVYLFNAAAYNTISSRAAKSLNTSYYQQTPSYGTVKMFGQQSGIAATGKGNANGSLADGTYVSGCGAIYLWDWAVTWASPYFSMDIKYGDDNKVWAINPNSTADARSGVKFGFVGSWDMDHEMKYIWAATSDHKLFRYSFNAVIAGAPQAVEGYYPVYSFEPDSNNVSPTKTSTMLELGGQYWFQPNNVTFKTWQGDFDPATAETGPFAMDGHYPLYVLQSSALEAGQAGAETSVYTASDGIGYFVPGGITTWDGDYDPATSETGPIAVEGHYPLYLTSGGALAESQAFSNDPGVERVEVNNLTYFMPENVSYETWSDGGYSDSTPLAVNGYYPVFKSELGAKTEALAAYALVGSDAEATTQHYTLNNVTYYMPTGVPYTTWTGDYDASTSDATPLNVSGYYPLNLTYVTAKASGFGGVGTVAIDGTLYYYATNGLKVWLGDYNPQTSDIEPMAVEGYYPMYYTSTSAGENAQQIIFGDQVYYLKVDGNEYRGSYGSYDYDDVIENSVKISSSTLTDYDITSPGRIAIGEGFIAMANPLMEGGRGMISVYNYDGEFQWSAFAPYGFANTNQNFGSALSIYNGKLYVGHYRYGQSNAQYGAVHVYNLSKTPVTVPSYASNREYMGAASDDYQNSGMLRQGDYVSILGPGGMPLANRSHNSYFGNNLATGNGLLAVKANNQVNPDATKTVKGVVSVYDAETLEFKFNIGNRGQVASSYFALDLAIGCGVIAVTEYDVVQVYDLEGNFITTVYPYNNSNLRVAYDKFGQFIEIDGEYMIIGQSEAHETNVSKGGVIHVFNINSIKNGTYDPNSTDDVMLWGPPHRVANSLFGYSGIHAYGRFWSGHAYSSGTDSSGTSVVDVGGLYSYDVDGNRPSYGTIINSSDVWQPSGTELDGITSGNAPRFGQYVVYKDGVLVVGGYQGYDSARSNGGYYKIYRLAPETFSIADEATVSEIVEGADSANVSDMTLDTSPSISLFLSTHRHQLTDRPTSIEQYCPATTAINAVSTVLSPSAVNGTPLYKIQFENHRPTTNGTDYLDPEPNETIVRHFRSGERVQNIQGTASGTIYSVRASLNDGGGSGSDYMNVYDTTGTFNVGDSVQLVGTKPKDNELARNWVKVASQQIEKFYFIKHIGNGVILAGSGDMESSVMSYANLNSRRLFRSDDYGTTWSVMDPAAELGHPVADDMYKTAYIPFMYTACEDLGDGKALIAVGNDSLSYNYADMIPYMLRTEDYGLTWSIVEPVAPVNTPPDTIEYGGVYVEWMKQIKAIRHLGNGVVLAGVGEHSIQGPRANYKQSYNAGLLVRSTDYGQTWTPIKYENDDFASNSIGIRSFSTNKINGEWWMASYDGSWAAGNDFALELHRSSDEGLTWTKEDAYGLHSDQVSNSHAPFIDSMIQLDTGTILISQGGSPGTSSGHIYRYSDPTTFPLSGSVRKSIPNSIFIDTMELTELSDLPGYVIATAKSGMPGYAVVALSRNYGGTWEVMNEIYSTGVGDYTKYALGKDAFRSFVAEYVGNGRIIAGSGGNATKVTYSSATLTESVGKRFEPMNYGHLWVSDIDSNYLEKIGRTIMIDLGEDNLVGNGDSIHIDFDQYISKLDGMEGKMKFYDANGLEIVTGDHSDLTTEIKIKNSTGASNIGDHLVSVRSSGVQDYFGVTRPNTITGLNRLSNMLDGSFETYFEFVLSEEEGCPYPAGWSRTAAQVAGDDSTTWYSSEYDDITWYDFSPGSMPWMGNEDDSANIDSYKFWLWYQVSRQSSFKYMMVFEDKDGNEKWERVSTSYAHVTINERDDIGLSLNLNGLFGHRLKSIAFFGGGDDKTVMKIFGFGGTVEGVDFTYDDDDYMFGPYKVGLQSTASDQNSSYGPSLFAQKRLRLEIESTTRKARYLRIPVIDAQAIRDIGIE